MIQTPKQSSQREKVTWCVCENSSKHGNILQERNAQPDLHLIHVQWCMYLFSCYLILMLTEPKLTATDWMLLRTVCRLMEMRQKSSSETLLLSWRVFCVLSWEDSTTFTSLHIGPHVAPGQESGLSGQSVVPSCRAAGILLSEELQHSVWQLSYQEQAGTKTERLSDWTQETNELHSFHDYYLHY